MAASTLHFDFKLCVNTWRMQSARFGNPPALFTNTNQADKTWVYGRPEEPESVCSLTPLKKKNRQRRCKKNWLYFIRITPDSVYKSFTAKNWKPVILNSATDEL